MSEVYDPRDCKLLGITIGKDEGWSAEAANEVTIYDFVPTKEAEALGLLKSACLEFNFVDGTFTSYTIDGVVEWEINALSIFTKLATETSNVQPGLQLRSNR